MDQGAWIASCDAHGSSAARGIPPSPFEVALNLFPSETPLSLITAAAVGRLVAGREEVVAPVPAPAALVLV